jgi:DNA-binding NtrC family response regulator
MLVDDQEDILTSFRLTLLTAGVTNVITEHDSRNVMEVLNAQEIELLLLDLTMPHVPGDEILKQVGDEFPQVPVIIITGTNEMDTAIDCMRLGAWDYMVKPVEPTRLVTSVKQAIELREMKREISSFGQVLAGQPPSRPEVFRDIVTRSPAMHAIFHYLEMVSATPRPILINGETGAGKELIARSIHSLSGRQGQFVPINAAGLDDTLFTDTLFGHEKGAFTGAERQRTGLIEKAAGGTLFLDEIGDLEIASQIKLLRLLQDGEYFSLGSDIPKRSDARVVVATHQDLVALQAEGRFRKDLYYRLSTHKLQIPPLRQRMDDIPLLLHHFIAEAAATLGTKIPTPPPELATLLATYHFPGNIRELQGMVFDAVAQHTGGTLSTKSFRLVLSERRTGDATEADRPAAGAGTDAGLRIAENGRFPTLQESEQFVINEAMKRSEGNQIIASEMLGLTRSALQRRLKRSTD